MLSNSPVLPDFRGHSSVSVLHQPGAISPVDDKNLPLGHKNNISLSLATVK